MKNVYLALDFPTWDKANNFLIQNELHEVPVKVGMELFYREGTSVIDALKERNHPVFLDLKLHDIPTTVMRSMRNLATLEVDYVNLHALGGSEMIKRAKEGLQSSSIGGSPRTKLLAVTILTSMDETMMKHDLGLSGNIEDNVVHLSEMAKRNGADGVVCSVHEVKKIKEACSNTFLTMTPGIRLKTSKEDDQKRIATPKVAKLLGTDAIVVGRSITQAIHPLAAYKDALEEWKNGTSK